ncbi:hypothetical protein [Ideonella sp.]|uniref:hypothetical protein n=1 Tax=Ideonella sp. TaxID=1929293 RepID=UPI0035AFDE21
MAAPVLQIIQLGSMARSGETLFQRTLAVHPQVHVVHDLWPTNTAAEMRLFNLLRLWPANEIDRASVAPLLDRPLDDRVTHLLLKQGVFQPLHDWRGVVLLRNPYAMFCSLWRYDAQQAGEPDEPARHLAYWQARRLPRLLAWADAMHADLSAQLQALDTPIEQFLHFYAARTRQLAASGQPILPYEDFVNRHAEVLPWLCETLGLPWDDRLPQAHRAFRAGERGHGGIDLGAPVHASPDWTRQADVPLEPFLATAAGLGLERYVDTYNGVVAQPQAVA